MTGRPGVFITGTDTGVGKTFVGVKLALRLAESGLRVKPRKPVESGCRRQGNDLIAADAQALLAAAQSGETLAAVCPYRFEAAVSPARAARLAGVSLNLTQLVHACCSGLAADDFLLVEGAGGFYSPLTLNALNADLAGALGLPVLLIAADRLGALNHVLLTCEAITRRGLRLAAVVLNRLESTVASPTMDNAQDLGARLDVPLFAMAHATQRQAVEIELHRLARHLLDSLAA